MYEKLVKIKYKNQVLLGLIIVFALILRLFFFTGMDASDSLGYANVANMLAKGEFVKEAGAAGLRLGLLYPISVLYSIFGVNEVTSNILILLISLSSIILIYNFGALLFSRKVGLLSAFLLSFFPLDVVYSTRLMTDLPAAFFAALSVFFFLKSEKKDKNAISSILCFFSGLSLGIAYLIKELSLLIGLFFIIHTIYNRRIKSRYFVIPLGFILMYSIELLFFLYTTGNLFYRSYIVESDWIPRIIATNYYGRGDFPSGLFHYPWVIFTDNLLGLFYPFIFIAIIYCIFNRKKETYNLLFWFIPVLLYISFGSASLTRYIPIPAAARFLSIITIPGILLLSYFLAQDEQLIKKTLMPSILALLAISSLGYVYISDHRFILDDERGAYEYLSTLPDKLIYTDDRTVMVFDYLSGFKNKNNVKSFNQYDFLNPENTYTLNLSQIEDSHIVINRELINFKISSKKGIEYPQEIFYVPESWILKKEVKRKQIQKKSDDKIEIYYIP